MFYQVSKIQLALNTPALYPCQRAIPLSTARISLPGLGSLKNKDSDLLNKGVAKSDSTRELLNRNTAPCKNPKPLVKKLDNFNTLWVVFLNHNVQSQFPSRIPQQDHVC